MPISKLSGRTTPYTIALTAFHRWPWPPMSWAHLSRPSPCLAGTIHAAQEMECHGLVGLGQEVSCQAILSRPVRRGDWSIMTAQFQALSLAGDTLLDGKTTVMIPDGREQLG